MQKLIETTLRRRHETTENKQEKHQLEKTRLKLFPPTTIIYPQTFSYSLSLSLSLSSSHMHAHSYSLSLSLSLTLTPTYSHARSHSHASPSRTRTLIFSLAARCPMRAWKSIMHCEIRVSMSSNDMLNEHQLVMCYKGVR